MCESEKCSANIKLTHCASSSTEEASTSVWVSERIFLSSNASRISGQHCLSYICAARHSALCFSFRVPASQLDMVKQTGWEPIASKRGTGQHFLSYICPAHHLTACFPLCNPRVLSGVAGSSAGHQLSADRHTPLSWQTAQESIYTDSCFFELPRTWFQDIMKLRIEQS